MVVLATLTTVILQQFSLLQYLLTDYVLVFGFPIQWGLPCLTPSPHNSKHSSNTSIVAAHTLTNPRLLDKAFCRWEVPRHSMFWCGLEGIKLDMGVRSQGGIRHVQAADTRLCIACPRDIRCLAHSSTCV